MIPVIMTVVLSVGLFMGFIGKIVRGDQEQPEKKDKINSMESFPEPLESSTPAPDITFEESGQIAKLSTGHAGAMATGDFNNDGYLDLIEIQFFFVHPDYYYKRSLKVILYRNNGKGGYIRVGQIAEIEIPNHYTTRDRHRDYVVRATAGDFDKDGDVDLIINYNGAVILYKNTTTPD